MAHNGAIINCTKISPCPICGKPDWCNWFAGDNSMLLSCKRAIGLYNPGDDVHGYDGNIYHFIKERDGQFIYVETFDYEKSKKNYVEAHKYIKRFKYIDEVKACDDYTCNVVYRALLDELVLEERHKSYLLSEGWTEEMIVKSNFKSFPESDYNRVKKVCPYSSKNPTRRELASRIIKKLNIDSLKGIPGAYYKDSYWTFAGRSGILMPIYDRNYLISRLRVRMDYMDIVPTKIMHGYPVFSENSATYRITMSGVQRLQNGSFISVDDDRFSGRYRPFHSFFADQKLKEDGIIKNIYHLGVQAENKCSIYQKLSDDFSLCIITEGEKKGQFTNFAMNVPVVSLPGVNSYNLLFEEYAQGSIIDYMRSKGCKVFVVAYDADMQQKKEVAAYCEKTINKIKEKGCNAAIAKWDIACGKGIDDMLSKGYFPEFVMM